MQLCIFEDKEYFKFEPLVFCRPVFDLKVGASTIREKIADSLNFDSYTLLCRDYLKKTLNNQNPAILINEFLEDDYLFVNGRIFPNSELKSFLPDLFQGNLLLKNADVILAAYLSKDLIKKYFRVENPEFMDELFNNLPSQETELDYFTYCWDLINQNENFIKQDFDLYKSNYSNKKSVNKENNFHLINEEKIFISDSSKIGYGVVLDALSGPIIIDENAAIMHNTVIYGPCYIGKNAFVKSNTTIYGGTSIGNYCKVAGEVSNSILMDFSNKQHDGFLGHSFLGSWVNLGAGTVTSNLKNNYSKIRAELSFGTIKTDLQFLGLLAGDHSKSAIGTRFNTATIVGFSSNIFGSGFTDKFIPSFAWGSINSKDVYQVDKAIEVAKIVLSRRNKNFTQKDYNLFLTIFNHTASIREKYGYK